jgi:uncharacterized protein (TIGR00251 family)
MKERKFNLHNGQSGAAITVRVTPRSSRNEISEILADGTIKVRLASPKAEEKTNQALIEFLSQILDVKPSQLEIVAGMSGNDKLITITDLDSAAVQERVLRSLS